MRRRTIHMLFLTFVLGLFAANIGFGFTAGLDPSLAAWWKLDEGSGTVANDSSGNNNTGTLNGNPQWVPGKIGGAWSSDGSGDYIDCGNGPSLSPTEQITIALWINSPGFGSNQWGVFVSKGDTGASYRFGRNNTGNGGHFGLVGVTASGNPWFDGVGTIADGTWHHAAATYDGAQMRIYIDAVEDSSLAATGQISISSTNVMISENAAATGRSVLSVFDDVRIYSKALTTDELKTVMRGFTAPIATDPIPAIGGTDVPRDAVLNWEAGPYAATHDVFFGTAFDDVNNAGTGSPLLVSAGQTETTFDPAGLLDFGQTYYWRVDEVNAPPTNSTRFKGETWSFTAEPYGYPITTSIIATASSQSNVLTGPGKTVDSSGLDSLGQHSTSSSHMWLSKKNVTPIWIQYEFDNPYKLHQMWVWNQNQLSELDYGLGAMEVSIEYSTDGTTWTALEGVPEFAQATGEDTYVHNTTVDFHGVSARFVKLNIISNFGGLKQAGLSEVRFFYVPVKAYEPTPADEATGVALDSVLNWRPGREAVSHEVYLGTDPNALSKVGTVTEHSYALGSLGLEYGKTYFWKVNEVNDAATPTAWEGPVWSFTTVGYAVVEDFESYDDLCNRIFWTWVDQYGFNASAECGGASAAGNGSGSTVGNSGAPYAERTIVNSGRQSMPMAFDNTRSPYYSEAQREWTSPQAWTGGGANTLRIHLNGIAAGFVETSPGAVLMNGIGTDIWDVSDQFRYVYKQLSGNGSIVARVDSLTRANEWSKAGVMIRETLEAGSAHAFVAATPTPTHGVSFQRRETVDTASTSTDANMVPATLPYWVKLTRTGNVFTAQRSTDGVTWVDITPTSSLTFTMVSNVYIGLAVTSHTATLVSGAKFSNVSTTGGVSGSWQVADIGVAQVPGNTPETCYVAVQDSGGKLKVVSNPDPTANATGNWEEWNIPLSQFSSAGVNLNSVKKLIVGVGDRLSPKAGNAGTLYIDDVRLTRVSAP